jgi:hypothetical protein
VVGTLQAPRHPPAPPRTSAVTPTPASSAPSTLAAGATWFAGSGTITWTNDDEPIVRDIQDRLALLRYLVPLQNNTLYADSRRTTDEVQWQPLPDRLGFYQNATDSAIRAFEFDYMQGRHGRPPGTGCSSETYAALVAATG